MLQTALPLVSKPSYAPQDFVVSESNRTAFELIQAAPDWPAPILAITGEAGAGKTHLVHMLSAHATVQIIEMQMLGKKTADKLLGDAQIAVLEDVQYVREEEALAQLINEVRARGTMLLFTARCPLAHLPALRADLASRLKAVVEVAIAPPDDALLYALLRKAFADRQLRVGEDVITYLLTRMERSAQSALRLVEVIDENALRDKREITLALVRQTLSDSAAPAMI